MAVKDRTPLSSEEEEWESIPRALRPRIKAKETRKNPKGYAAEAPRVSPNVGGGWVLTPLHVTPIQSSRITLFCINSFAPKLCAIFFFDSERREKRPGTLQGRAALQPHRGYWVRNPQEARNFLFTFSHKTKSQEQKSDIPTPMPKSPSISYTAKSKPGRQRTRLHMLTREENQTVRPPQCP